MHKHDAQRTGRSTYDTSENDGTEKWKYFFESSVWGSISIDKKNIIYVGTPYEEYHALYPNGTNKWKKDLVGRDYQAPAIAPDGTIYFGTDDWFYALHPNGTKKWRFNISGNYFCEPVVDSNGTVYTATQDGYVYAIYSNGSLKWEYFVADYVFYIALDHNENIYFNGCAYENKLFCLNPDGSVKWKYKEINIWGGPVIDDNGIIYIHSDELIALYPNGTEKWIIDLGDNDCYGYPSIAPDGTIILSGYQGYITALNPSDGSRIWQYILEPFLAIDEMSEASIGADGTIFVAYTYLNLNIGYMCAISNDGKLKWKKQITSDINPYGSITILSDPSIGKDGTVFITSWFHTSGSSIQGIGSYGYVHAFGSGDEKQVTITKPEEGYLYINNNKIKKNLIRKSIIFGDLHLNINITSQNEVKRIVCTLRSHHPFYNMWRWETKCQIFEIGMDTNLPYELVIDASKFKYNLRMYTLQINVDYNGGCTASDRITFYYLRNINPFIPMPKPSVKWRFNTGSYTVAKTLTIYDNFIYFSCISGDVFCLDAYTGDLQWKYSIGEWVETKPLVVNSKVYVGSDDGRMYCIDANSGDLLWIYPTFDYIQSNPKYWNGCIYFGCHNNRLYCIDAETGDFKWSFLTNDDVYTDPSIYDGKVYVASRKDHLFCIDATTGEEIWRIKDRIRSSPVAVDGKVYYSGNDRFLFCVNSSDGDLIWSYETGSHVSTVAVVDGCVYFNGLSYFCGEYTMLYCVDADDGRLLWSSKIAPDWDLRPFDPVSVANGKVYGCYSVNYVYCHDAENGEILWMLENDFSLRVSPVYLDGMFYIDLGDNNLYCLIEPDI